MWSFTVDACRAMESSREDPFYLHSAISFLVNCETQEEVNELGKKLSEGGEKEQCGWLKDKYMVCRGRCFLMS